MVRHASSSTHSLLPSHWADRLARSGSTAAGGAHQPLTRRAKLVFGACALALLYLFYSCAWRLTAPIPPNYREWHLRELALPQNDPDLPYPQGRDGVYVRFSNHVTSECPPRLFFSLRPGPNVCAQSWGGATMCRR